MGVGDCGGGSYNKCHEKKLAAGRVGLVKWERRLFFSFHHSQARFFQGTMGLSCLSHSAGGCAAVVHRSRLRT